MLALDETGVAIPAWQANGKLRRPETFPTPKCRVSC